MCGCECIDSQLFCPRSGVLPISLLPSDVNIKYKVLHYVQMKGRKDENGSNLYLTFNQNKTEE